MRCLVIIFLFAACKQETTAPKIQADSIENDTARKSSIGNQKVISVPVNSWGGVANALLYLPPEYGNDDKRYPIIIHLPGISQQGNDIRIMLNDGLCKRIADGLEPSAKNPADGKTYQFIVFSPQGPQGSWGWQHSQVMNYMLPYLVSNYRIDTTRLYVTGYSAGGWGAVTFMDNDTEVVKKIAAISPVAPAAIDNEQNLKYAAKYGLATWSIVGENDAFLINATKITNNINNNNPVIKAKLTVIQNIGHSAWVQAYNPKWYDPDDPKKLNLYEWFLQYKRKPATSR